jgi:hypothetical protein
LLVVVWLESNFANFVKYSNLVSRSSILSINYIVIFSSLVKVLIVFLHVHTFLFLHKHNSSLLLLSVEYSSEDVLSFICNNSSMLLSSLSLSDSDNIVKRVFFNSVFMSNDFI